MIISMPGVSVAFKKQWAANPMPPAAPAPGSSRSSRPSALAVRSAKWPSARSSVATSASVAPFCGPKTALAPRSPSSGLSTSTAASTRNSAKRGSNVERSRIASCWSAAPPGGSGWPWASSSVAPNACSIPAPASLVALPPSSSRAWVAPASRAARNSSPTPKVVVCRALRSAWVRCCRPLASASSINAVRCSLSQPQAAWRGRPRASCTVSVRRSAWVAAIKASRLPSPPSARGQSCVMALGAAR